MEKIYSCVSIEVPYRKAGNVIMQHEVLFDVYKEDDVYILIPLLSEDERRIANLPPELKFTFGEGRLQSLRGNRDGNFHVIQDAADQLRKNNVL